MSRYKDPNINEYAINLLKKYEDVQFRKHIYRLYFSAILYVLHLNISRHITMCFETMRNGK